MRRATLLAALLGVVACSRGAYPVDVYPEMHYGQAQRRLEPERLTVADGAVPTSGRAPRLSFEEAGRQPNPLPRTPATVERGRRVYARDCAMCHGADGHARTLTAAQFAGAGREPPVDLAAPRVRERSDGQLHWIISHGLGGMPPFRDLLTDQDRWALVHALRELEGL